MGLEKVTIIPFHWLWNGSRYSNAFGLQLLLDVFPIELVSKYRHHQYYYCLT